MGEPSLKKRIYLAFFTIILVISLSIALLGFYLIKSQIVNRAKDNVKDDLIAARGVYESEIDSIGESLRFVPQDAQLDLYKIRLKLDYLKKVNISDLDTVQSEIVKTCFTRAEGVGAIRIIGKRELSQMDTSLQQRASIEIKFTPRAIPTDRQMLDTAMSKEYAHPIFDTNGNVTDVLYGGRIINQDHSLVDRIRKLVFGDRLYDKKPYGTVTVFQDDVRIATNVLTEEKKRAIGTRVSAEVYRKVIKEGQLWHDRAFVVTDWYITAYEPIRNLNGTIIGMLYVGILEKPFTDIYQSTIVIFIFIILIVIIVATIFGMLLARGIIRPILRMLKATNKLSQGDFNLDLKTDTDIRELNDLAKSINYMAENLREREESLKLSNEQLEESNKSYVDLISFVAHELNGILGSAIMNTYAVRDGFLGMVNFKQRKAIDSVARNLDYLASTVKKFLTLGRIERGALPINKSTIYLKKDVIDISIESLSVVASRKNITVVEDIDNTLTVNADPDLLLIVSNNLISNAIKYGTNDSQVLVNARTTSSHVEVEVFNAGEPISEDQQQRLFKKFSRLENKDTKRVKGNGLGLYITKNIIEAHGGTIRVEPKSNGNSFIFQIERGQ